MDTKTRTRATLLAVLAATVVALTGCGGAEPSPPEIVDTTDSTVVTVIATEFAFTLSTSTFSPGTYTFELTNEGAMPHDLVVEGANGDRASTAIIGPGETASVTVQLEAGTYELWCSVSGHRARGMDLTIEVA